MTSINQWLTGVVNATTLWQQSSPKTASLNLMSDKLNYWPGGNRRRQW